jgi:type I restriction enzyme S subunit
VNLEGCIHDGWLLLRDFRDLHKEFAFYCLEVARPALLRQGGGSIFTNLKTSILKEHRIFLPPLPEQRRIAAVLGALDDKIELNHKMNRTLEEMAQAIFKSWFIDFDGHDDLVDSELGPIPRGWELRPIADLIDFNPRTSLKKGTVAKFVEMKAVPTGGCSVSGYIEKVLKSGGAKFMQGDTLLARITPCLENGKTALVDFLEDDEVAFGSGEFIVMRPNERLGFTWVYCLARSAVFRAHAISNMSGSSGRQRVDLDCFDHFAIPNPDSATLNSFHRATAFFFDRIKSNVNESRSLSELRDTLLPKLISGEIRVPGDRAELEAVV